MQGLFALRGKTAGFGRRFIQFSVPENFFSKTNVFYSTLYKRVSEYSAVKSLCSVLYVVSLEEENKKIFFDYTAYMLIEKLDMIGINAPEYISVIGFDDVIYSQISNPKITTMRVSRTDMAEQSVELMVRRIKYKSTKLINMTLECTMIERESVSPPPPDIE